MIPTRETRSTRRETCPSAPLSTKKPTRTGPGSNPFLRVDRPAITSLSPGTATDNKKLIRIIFKYSISASQATHDLTTTKTIRSVLYTETSAVCCENHTQRINTTCRTVHINLSASNTSLFADKTKLFVFNNKNYTFRLEIRHRPTTIKI